MPKYIMKAGFVTNPLRAHRNILCPCQSGKKAKRCCGLIHAVPESVAEKLETYLKFIGVK